MTEKDYENKITQHYFYMNIRPDLILVSLRAKEKQGVLKNGFLLKKSFAEILTCNKMCVSA
jgi:hypothetical protein